MKNNLPIDNPPKTMPHAATKRPVLPIHAGNGGFKVVMADSYSLVTVLPTK